MTACNGLPIPVVGRCRLSLTHKKEKTKDSFVIVTGMPVLGWEASQKLGLTCKQFNIEHNLSQGIRTLEKKHTAVFKGLGKLPVMHKVTLKKGANPVIHPARKVLVALRGRLQRALQRLLAMELKS